MTYSPSVLGTLFFLAAAYFGYCEALAVYEYAMDTNASHYIMLASLGVACVTPVLPGLADWARRGRHWVWSMSAVAAFAVCLLIVVTAAVQRTGTATDAAQQTREQAERAGKVFAAAEKQAEADYKAAQDAALTECRDGRKARCMDAEAKAEKARIALAKARADLVRAPIGAQVDPLARRLAGWWLTEDQIRLLQPLLLPMAMSLLSALFFAGWTKLDLAHSVRIVPEAPKIVPQPVSRVIDIEPARKQRTALAVKYGAVAAYFVSRAEPAEGEDIEIEGSMYNDYVRWCRIGQVEPYTLIKFAQELRSIAEAGDGLEFEMRGKQAFVLDHRLAA